MMRRSDSSLAPSEMNPEAFYQQQFAPTPWPFPVDPGLGESSTFSIWNGRNAFPSNTPPRGVMANVAPSSLPLTKGLREFRAGDDEQASTNLARFFATLQPIFNSLRMLRPILTLLILGVISESSIIQLSSVIKRYIKRNKVISSVISSVKSVISLKDPVW